MSLQIKWVFPCTLLLSLSLLGADERFTLQRFVDLAVKNSQGIQIVLDSVAIAEQKVGESKSLYYPQVSLAASYSRLSLVSEFDIDLGGQPMHIKFMSPDNYSFRVSASEQVFNWGRTQKTVKLNEFGVSMAQDGVDLVRQMTAYQVVPIYYNLLFAGEAIKVLDETRSLFEQKLKIIKTRYAAGLASDFDISLIQVQMSGIDSQRSDFQNALRKLTLSYNRIANLPPENSLLIEDRLDFQPLALNEKKLLEEALENRIELKQLGNQERLFANQVALARTGNKPTLVASFNYEVRNGFLPNVDQLRGNWTAALSASMPVFDGFRTRSQVAQAEIGKATVQKQRADLEDGIAAEIRQLVSDLKTLEQKNEIEKVKLGHAQKALKIAEERYEKGLLSTTDLIEAQNTLANSRLGLLQITVNYVLSQYNLFRAVGRKIYRSDS